MKGASCPFCHEDHEKLVSLDKAQRSVMARLSDSEKIFLLLPLLRTKVGRTNFIPQAFLGGRFMISASKVRDEMMTSTFAELDSSINALCIFYGKERCSSRVCSSFFFPTPLP